MCGIFGAALDRPQAGLTTIEGLKRLEYRGYDSAGVATMAPGELETVKVLGRPRGLEGRLREGCLSIGHTRWATHGAPSVVNAHPHRAGRVAVVHNGIIENYQDLKTFLEASGRSFSSQTDTEVIAHLIDHLLDAEDDALLAIGTAVGLLEGSYAIAVMIENDPQIYAARDGSPLSIGLSRKGMYLASDTHALEACCDRITHLKDGDVVAFCAQTIKFIPEDVAGERVFVPLEKRAHQQRAQPDRSWMWNEVQEQPASLARSFASVDRFLEADPGGFDLVGIKRVVIAACGTACHAGEVARSWFARYARIPVDVEPASELRDSLLRVDPGTLLIAISQSGETADTLGAVAHLRKMTDDQIPVLAIVNTPQSALARQADRVIELDAGQEIGVASTKAFTSQLMVLARLALEIGLAQNFLRNELHATLCEALRSAPQLAQGILDRSAEIEAIGRQVYLAPNHILIGRGQMAPVASEGALKIKETSYRPADGYPAGELKHGPLALVESGVPCFVLMPDGNRDAKVVSSMREIMARGGDVILLSDAARDYATEARHVVDMPAMDDILAPILYTLPLQIISHDIATRLGHDVDHPRNLAKAVSVS